MSSSRIVFSCFVLLLILIPNITTAQDCIDYAGMDPHEIPLRWAYPGSAEPIDAVTIGEYGYLLDAEGIKIHDLSALPELLEPVFVNIRAEGRNLELVGDRLLVAASGGLQVWDVSDPAMPVRLDTVLTESPPRRFATDGSIVYTADNSTVSRLGWLDGVPYVEKSWTGLPTNRGFAVIDSVFWGSTLEEIRAHDLREGGQGNQISAMSLHGYIYPEITGTMEGHLVVHRYHSMWEGDSAVFFDVNTDGAMERQWIVDFAPGKMTRFGDILYLSGHFLDISNGIPGGSELQHIPDAMVALGSPLTLVVGDRQEWSVVDLNDPSLPVIALTGARFRHTTIMRKADDHRITNNHLWQMNNEGPPSLVHEISDHQCWKIQSGCEGGLLYTLNSTEVLIEDISNPYDIQEVVRVELMDFFDLDMWIGAFSVHDEIAYFAVRFQVAEVLRMIDISNPLFPVALGDLALPNLSYCSDLTFEGDLLFALTQASGWYIVDVSDPTDPVLLSRIPGLGEAHNIRVFGNLVAVGYKSYGFTLHDINDLADPRQIGSIPTSLFPQDILIHDQRAYMIERNSYLCDTVPTPGSRMHVFDLSPGYPLLTATVLVPEEPTVLALSGQNLILGTAAGGWYGLPLDCGSVGTEPPPSSDPESVPARLRLLPAVPNPFNPRTRISWEQDRPGQVTVSVYDLAGRLVTTLTDESHTKGRHTETWDGLDSRGRGAAAGTYLVRITQGDDHDALSVTMTK